MAQESKSLLDQMDLLENIKRKRARQKRKQPIRRDVFNQISGIVRLYGLKESFLADLEHIEDHVSSQDSEFPRVRMKTAIECPLFSLATGEEYSLTVSIISKVDNSYLRFAHSPDEILVCALLYRMNPSLSPEKLRRYHFETLLLHECTKTDNETSNGSITGNSDNALQSSHALNRMSKPDGK